MCPQLPKKKTTTIKQIVAQQSTSADSVIYSPDAPTTQPAPTGNQIYSDKI